MGRWTIRTLPPIIAGAILAMSLAARAADQPASEPERIHVGATAGAGQPASADSGVLPARRFDYERFRGRLEAHWFRRKALLEANNGAEAAEELTALETLCGEMGIASVPAVAAALVHEGDGFLREGNFSKAREAYTAALRFSSGLPQAHAGLARVGWRSGDGIGSAVGHGASAFAAAMRESWRTFRGLGNGLLVVLIAAGAGTVLFAGAMALRYQASVRHDVEERLSGALSPHTATTAGWIVLLLPLLTVVLAPWTPLWWLALTIRHCRPAERAVAALLLGFVVLSGPASILALTACRIGSDAVAKELMDAAGGSNHPESILALEELSKAHPEDALYPSLLGDLYARGHFLQEAMAQYGRASELAPSDPRPWNNIGNLYFQAGRHGEAATAYRKAVEFDARFLPGYVNLYLAEQKMFDFRQAEDALQRARGVDDSGVAELLESRGASGTATETAPSQVTTAEVWNRILARGPWSGSPASLAVQGLKSLPSVAGIAACLSALIAFALLGAEAARSCVRCGLAFCEGCRGGGDDIDECVQCCNLRERGGTAAASVRRARVDAIERSLVRRARLSRVLTLLVPGARDLLAGRTVRGTLLAAAWCLALATLALHGRLIQAPVPEPWPWAVLVPAAVASAITWAWANRPTRAA